MKPTASWRLGAAVTVLTLGLAGCGRGGDSAGDADSGGGDNASGFINPASDCDNYKGTAGVANGTIKVGTVRPAQGPYAIYDTLTVGLDAYFQSINDKGGVKAGDGKTYKLELVKGDDQYDPGKTPDEVKRLVENEGVFAMVGSVGTETNLAVRDYLNDACVPSIALATGSPLWGKADSYPWYIGGLPSYATEAVRFMEYLDEKKPNATMAVLYQNDDFGKSYLAAIKKFIKDHDSKIKVVAEKSFDQSSGQTTQGVTTQLAQSKADVFYVGIGGTPCPATLGFVPANWKPMTYVSITCSGKLALSLAGGRDEGVITGQATLDPASKGDQGSPGMKEYMAAMRAQKKADIQINGGIVSAGWGFGAIFVKGLELAPKVDRAAVMNALYSMKNEHFGLIRDGVTVSTDGANDPWILEDLRLVQRKSGDWVEVSPMKKMDGTSNDLAG